MLETPEWDRKKYIFSFDITGHKPDTVFSLFAQSPYSLFFDSNDTNHPDSRYSYICVDPYETIECRAGNVRIQNKHNEYNYRADPFQAVKERLALRSALRQRHENLPPFQGGLAGFFGYDLAYQMENIYPRHKEPVQIPDLCIGLYDKVFCFDHQRKKAWLIVHDEDKKSAQKYFNDFQEKISSAKTLTGHQGVDLEWHSARDDESYEKDIERVIEYIRAGDIFQANLSRRFSAKTPDHFDFFAHYRQVRAINAAPFSAYMNFDDFVLSGASPERFLSLNKNIVETKPIKGTLSTQQNVDVLRNSVKDKAENAMIVDLLRNDLSKVCEDHSILVDKLFDIESFSGLHHMVSTIRGTLRADCNALDLLRACFPGGSITGAPKIRAMQIIEELEPQRRGPYCGASGFIGYDGAMETNIMIRTIVFHDGMAHLQAGGGITALSDPASERREVETKLHKMFESFKKDAA